MIDKQLVECKDSLEINKSEKLISQTFELVYNKVTSFIRVLPLPLKLSHLIEHSIEHLSIQIGKNKFKIPIRDTVHPNEYCDLIDLCIKHLYPKYYKEVDCDVSVDDILKQDIELALSKTEKIYYRVERIQLKKDKFKIKNLKTNQLYIYKSYLPIATFLKNIRNLSEENLAIYMTLHTKKILNLDFTKVKPDFSDYKRSQINNFIILNYLRIENFDIDIENKIFESILDYCKQNIKSEKNVIDYFGIRGDTNVRPTKNEK